MGESLLYFTQAAGEVNPILMKAVAGSNWRQRGQGLSWLGRLQMAFS